MGPLLNNENKSEREERRSIEFKTGSPYKVQSWAQKVGPNLAPQEGQGFVIRPPFSVSAKGVESSDKKRQIRPQMHAVIAMR
jgi:hypothetical protein